MADKAIGELDAVTESPISGLPEVLELYDETLIPVEQQGAAHKMSGKQFRQFGEKAAETYVNTAKDAAAAAANSASFAKQEADRAQELRDGIELDYDYLENARLEAQQSAQQAKESENAAKSSQAAAGDSAAAAAAGAAVIEENAGAIRAIEDNLEAVQHAAENALAAAGSAASAALDAQRAEDAADRAQSIAQGAKGYYPTAQDLRNSLPMGSNGDWAIVGQTDTIWIWDGDTSSWSDSGQNIDLSDYYTKDEADAALDGKVDKEAGKGLSSNDYTAEEKSKLAGIAAGAQVNSVTSVNAQTGAVNLTAENIGAFPATIPIELNTDLNDIRTPGVYLCGSNATTLTLENCPVTVAFGMLVMKTTTESGITQEVVTYTVNAYKVYRRNYYNGTWGNWQRSYTTIDTPTPAEIGALPAGGELAIANGGTGASDRATAANNLIVLGSNTGGLSSVDEDTIEYWVNRGFCLAHIGDRRLHGQPTTVGYLLNLARMGMTHTRQLWFDRTGANSIYYRTGESGAWSDWAQITPTPSAASVQDASRTSAALKITYSSPATTGSWFGVWVEDDDYSSTRNATMKSITGANLLKACLANGSTVLSSNQYGTSLPAAGTKGRIFFLKS